MISMTRPRLLTASLLAVLSAAAIAHAGGAKHVQKIVKKDVIRMYWAQYLSQNEVQVYAFPHGTTVGEEFDIADQQGYVGRVTVTKVEQQPAGCNNIVYYVATASYTDAPGRAPVGTLIAFSPRKKAHANVAASQVLGTETVTTPPADMQARGAVPEVVLDWDGDKNPDLIRYYYDCPAQQAAQQGRIEACMDTFLRERSGAWALIEHYAITDCY